ncbi:MAG: biotin--[Bacilli bacterium]|nr:biotin--[acetyl-CoA-carboxylase] ligase [Bacilli bacterium]
MDRVKKYYFETLESTNDKAKEFNPSESEFVVYTNNQTKGRGQYDRIWLSNTGLTFSIILAKNNDMYNIIVPLAIIQYLKQMNIIARIKMPNDIYLKNKKLGGILIENIFLENKFVKSIIGIGLNINEKIEAENSICVEINEKTERIIENIFLNIKSLELKEKEQLEEMYKKELL